MSPPIQGVPQRMQVDRLRFPGMAPREILVFKNWLRAHETEYPGSPAPLLLRPSQGDNQAIFLATPFDYNFRIGNGFDPGPTWPEEQRRNAILNSQKRIDALAYRGGRVTIIEVKDRATFAAVGQIVAYNVLWQREFPTVGIEQLVIVCNRADPDTIDAAQKIGIRVDIFATDFSSLRGG
jgi:hypothetical protein